MYKSFKKSCLILLSALVAVMLVLACAFMLSPKTTAHADTEDENTDVAKVSFGNGGGSWWLSLEDAWESANTYTSATVTLLADVETTDTLTVESGKDITLNLNGHILKYNNTTENSVITVSENATFTLCDGQGTGVITGGNTNNGGGVYVDGGTFTMNGGTISGNTAVLGGGVYVAAGGTFTMENGTISDNTAYSGGGGVHVDGAFTIENGTISGNTVSEGGGGGVSVAPNAEFKMTGGEISENEAFNEDFAARGGGVFVGNNSTFIMENGTISGNTAKTDGGGLCIDFGGANVSVSGAPIITGNKAVMDGNEVTNNVCILGGEITVTGELTDGAQIGVSNTGAVITSGYGENNKDASNNIIAPDTYFVSDKEGYLPVLKDGEVLLSVGVATVTVDGVETKYYTIEEAWTFANGAEVAATVKMYADATVSSTLEVAEGKDITLDLNGYILRYSGGTKTGSVIKVFKSTFTLIDSNKTTTNTITNPVTEEEVTVSGGLITGGSNNFGAGVYVDGGTFTMNGGTLCGNANGDCVYVISILKYNAETDDFDIADAGTFIMNGGTVSGNAAGGVCVNDATFIMNGGTISGNVTKSFGGGVYVNGGTFKMTGGTVSGNTAKDGGGIYVNNGTFTMENGTVSENTASHKGGGVYVISGTLEMTGGTVSGNTAKDGGGLYVLDSTLKVSGAPKITGNRANSADSSVYLVNGNKITVTGALTEGAQICVTIDSENASGEIATGFTQADKPSEYFIPDDSGYNCVYISDETSGTVAIGTHDMVQHEAKEPTCTESGWEAHEGCSRCGYATNNVEIPVHGHKPTHHEATAATAEKEGNSEYWSCDECDRYFEDRACTKEITDKSSVTLPKFTPESPSAPAEDNQSYWWLFLLLIPLAIGGGGVALGIWVYKKGK